MTTKKENGNNKILKEQLNILTSLAGVEALKLNIEVPLDSNENSHKNLRDELKGIFRSLIIELRKWYLPDSNTLEINEIMGLVLESDDRRIMLVLGAILCLVLNEYEIGMGYLEELADIEGYRLPQKKAAKITMLDCVTRNDSRCLLFEDIDNQYTITDEKIKIAKQSLWLLLKVLTSSLYQLCLNETERVFASPIKERMDYEGVLPYDVVEFYEYYLCMSREVYDGGPFVIYVDLIDVLIKCFDSDFYLEDHRVYLNYIWLVAMFDREPSFTPGYSSSNYALKRMMKLYPKRKEFIMQKLYHLLDEVRGGTYEYEILEYCGKGLQLDSTNDFFLSVYKDVVDEISQMENRA